MLKRSNETSASILYLDKYFNIYAALFAMMIYKPLCGNYNGNK